VKKILAFFLNTFPVILIAQTQPNFVFITIDDCNDWVQGFSGHPQSNTPNIRFLEKKGTTFTNAYASAPQCAPSRTSMITGKDCDYTKIYHNQTIKCSNFRYNFNETLGNETIFTIPEILKDSGGYFTYSISKVMHCHDKLADYDALTADKCAKDLSWNKAIVFNEAHGEQDEVVDWGYANEQGVYEFACASIPDSLEPYMQDYIATDSAIEFIQDYAVTPENFCNKPFFLALGFRRPHSPNYIPEKYFSSNYNTDYYADPYNLPYNNPVGFTPYNGIVMPPQPTVMWDDYYGLPTNGVAQSLVKESPIHAAVLNWADSHIAADGLPIIGAGLTDEERTYAFEESQRANMVMNYLAAIKFVDAQIGRLIDEMKLHPEIFNNTVFVIMGDHGYSLGEKQHWKKGGLWETDIRVPLVIADMRTPVKKTCKRFVSQIDLFPTICDIASIEHPTFPDGSSYFDGFSLAPLLANPATPWARPIIASFINGKDITRQGACFVQYTVRDDEWQYIKYRTNGNTFPVSCDEATSVVQEELYHIGKKKNIDPYEWDNLADDPAYAATKDYLATFLPGGVNYLQFEKSSGDEIIIDDAIFVATLYPNPAADYINFSITDATEGVVEIIINDISGRVISSNNLLVSDEGYAHFVYPVKTLQPGYYFAEVTQNGNKQLLNFIVMR